MGRGVVRVLSAVVLMELRIGATTLPARRALDQLQRASRDSGRLIAPTADQLDRAGIVLQRLRASGQEIRRSSLVHDVLIALTARDLGATVVTEDRDFEVIRAIVNIDVTFVRA